MTDNPKRKPRKKRRDSQAEKAKIVQGATLKLEPPKSIPLCERGRVFFAEIVAERAKADWTPHDLSFAAEMANTMAMIQKLREQVDAEGYTIVNVSERGQTTRPHPLLSSISTFTSVLTGMRRSMALHARGRAGDNRNAAGQRKFGKALEDSAAHDDDLIPGLRLVGGTERNPDDE